jgi:formate dehydrogenase subunit gamma
VATTSAIQEHQARPQVDDFDASGTRILRFDRAERILHWVNATLVLILLVTGTTFYVGQLQSLVGHRAVLRQVHVWCGVALVVPFAVTLAGRWRRGFVLDAERLGRWTKPDFAWLRSRGKRGHEDMGKFNGGQKLNAVFIAGALPVTLLTGSIMNWHDPFPDSWRTGATFVHQLLWLGLLIVILGHIAKALSEPEALSAMLGRGWVPTEWARRHRAGWHREVVGEAADPDR